MAKKHKFIDARRRTFLQGSAVLTAPAVSGAASAVTTPEVVQPEQVTPDSDVKSHAGYRETDKVRQYYKKARLI